MASDRVRAGHPALWFPLLLAGQVATLRLIQAGPQIGYQHYVRLERLLSSQYAWPAGVFLLELVVVAWGAWRSREVLARGLAALGGRRLVPLGAVFVLTSATLSRDPRVFAEELALASLVQLVHVGAVVLLALSLDARQLARIGSYGRRILGPEQGIPAAAGGGPDRFTWGMAIAVAIVAALLAALSYQRHPHIPDEVVYLLQAQYLAAGRLSLSMPPVPPAFDVDLMMFGAGRWYSPVPPGWPMILAVGAVLKGAWLVNPVLAGLNVVLTSVLLKHLYPLRTVRLALLLLATSPWQLFMAMNLMSHTATLTFALLGACGVARLRQEGRLRWAMLGGIGIGVVGLIRPLEGLAVAGLLGLWSLGARGVRWRFGPSVILTVSSLAVGALVLPYNRYFTGSATQFPIMQYTDLRYGAGTNSLGFGPNRGLGWVGLDPLPGHGPIDVAVNADFNFFQTNVELHGWATGSLLVLALLLMAGPARREDWWMVSVVGLIVGIHSFYWFSGGPDFGARYWFLILVPCLVLTARGIEWLEASADRVSPGAGGRVLAAVATLMVVTLVVFVPWRAADKYYHYRGMRPDLRTLAEEHRFGDGVVLIRGNRHPDYASAVVYNPVDLSARRPLFVWDRGPGVRARLAEVYPDRSFWIVDGPTITRQGYAVVGGPLTGAQLVAVPDSAGPGRP